MAVAVAAAVVLPGGGAGQGATAGPRPQKPPAATCATCHAGVAASYAHAGMHHALEPPESDPVLAQNPHLSARIGNYSYSVDTSNGHSTYTVSDASGSVKLPIRWTFGQHSKTWVLEMDGKYYESQVSFFPLEHGLATTPGHASIVPRNLTEAVGRKTSNEDLVLCFNCHATDASDGTKLTLDRLRPGIACERCHQDAPRHMADALQGNFATRPRSLHAMNAEDASDFCGNCHRTWDTVIRNHSYGPADVRFQPYRLANSRCFLGRDARISCLACHNPHQPVNTSSESYDARCLACHAPAKESAAVHEAKASPGIKSCTVATSNCASCHMPRVTLPNGHAVFTDHEIRIVRPGDAYPN